MTSDPEESVRLQGYGEMTLRTAVATLMAVPARDRADAAVFRVRDGSRLAPREIAELASDWGIAQAADIKSQGRHRSDIVRRMVREAPLPALTVAFLMGVLMARR